MRVETPPFPSAQPAHLLALTTPPSLSCARLRLLLSPSAMASSRPHRGSGSQDGRSTTNGSANGSGASASASGYPRQPKASGSASAASGAGASSQLQSPHPHEVTSFIQTSFIPAVAPTQDELQAKDAAFLYLETFVERVAPGATLRPFGYAQPLPATAQTRF